MQVTELDIDKLKEMDERVEGLIQFSDMVAES